LNPANATKQHEAIGNDPLAWRMVAHELLDAAQFLRRTPSSTRDFGAVSLMLCGMAFENLLKALWLKQGNQLSAAGKFQPVPGAGAHELQQLAHVTGFAVSAIEGDVLRRLSHFIEYGGRYPIPKSPQKIMLTSAPGGGKGSATSWSTPSDDQCVEALLLRLERALT
jgi:hypothetical protein